MSRTYTYVGEAEQVVPFTVAGPRVVSAGDHVTIPDGESLDGHPLFEPVDGGGSSVPAVEAAQAGSETAAPVVPEPVVPEEVPAVAVEAVAEPVPAPADPTAEPAAGQE